MKLITIVQYAMWKTLDMAEVNFQRLKTIENEEYDMTDYFEIEKTMLDCLNEYEYLRKCLHRMSKEREVQKTLEDVLEW